MGDWAVSAGAGKLLGSSPEGSSALGSGGVGVVAAQPRALRLDVLPLRAVLSSLREEVTASLP